MDKTPLISVIIPVHNTAAYLQECVASMLGQSHRTVEVIAVDDASTDSSAALLRQMASEDGRIRVLSTGNTAQGPSVARNMGIQAAQGDFFCCLDSDDIYLPDALTELLQALERHPQAGFATAPLATFATDEQKAEALQKEYPEKEEEVVESRAASVAMLCQTGGEKGLTVSPCCKLFRSRMKGAVCFDKGRIYEDLDLLPRLCAEAGSVVCLRRPLYLYRLHGDSILGRFCERRLDVLSSAFRLRRAFAADAELRLAADTRLFAAAFNMLLNLLQPSEKDLAKRYRRRLGIILRALKGLVAANPQARRRDRAGALLLLFPGLKLTTLLLRVWPGALNSLLRRR